MSYFMIRSAAGYLQSGSLVAVAAPAADAVRLCDEATVYGGHMVGIGGGVAG